MSAEAGESLILTVFFLSGCTNPNRQYQRSRSEQQATSALFYFCRIFSSFCCHFNWNSTSMWPPSTGLAIHSLYVSGKCNRCFFLKQTLSLLPKTFASTTTNSSKTLSVNITLQTNSNTMRNNVCLFVCFGGVFFCSSPVRVTTEKHCGSCHQTGPFCDKATSLDKTVKTSKYV